MLMQKYGMCSLPNTIRSRNVVVFTFLFLFCFICVMPVAAADTTVMVKDATELMNNITAANNNPYAHYLIVIDQNIPLGNVDPPEITGNITLTTNSSENNKIYRTVMSPASSSGMFTIVQSGRLAIVNNSSSYFLTLDGNKSSVSGNKQPLVYVKGGGNFILDGGPISNNTANNGGGVYVTGSGSTFTMKSGSIIHNPATPQTTVEGYTLAGLAAHSRWKAAAYPATPPFRSTAAEYTSPSLARSR